MNEMEKLKLYTVIKGNTDGTLKPGYVIWISENGDLNIAQDKGWLSKEELDNHKTNDFEVKICDDYYLDVVGGHEIVQKLNERIFYER